MPTAVYEHVALCVAGRVLGREEIFGACETIWCSRIACFAIGDDSIAARGALPALVAQALSCQTVATTMSAAIDKHVALEVALA